MKAKLQDLADRWIYLAPIFTILFTGSGWLAGWMGYGAAEAILYTLAYLAGGTLSAYAGLKKLVLERLIDVDLLMVLAALGAAVVGRPEDGAILFVLFSGSNALQEYALNRTHDAVQALMKLRPDEANLVVGDEIRRVKTDEVQVGEIVRVKPGERIPLDGVVVKGSTLVDQSAITGESAGVTKSVGDAVFAGTVNMDGVIDVKVEKPAGQTTLARIVEMVAEARERKASLQLWTERFEQRYSVVVLLGTGLAIVIPLLLGAEFGPTFYRAMTLLVAASPCAIVITAPAALLSAMANLARNGVLVKGGAFLERLAGVTTFAFDKTGTLTRGRPWVVGVEGSEGHSPEEVLRLAASLEVHVDHALALAIVRAAKEKDLELYTADDVRVQAGKGVSGILPGGRRVYVGNRYYMEEMGIHLPASLERRLAEREDQGETVMQVAVGKDVVGLIAALDIPRPDAASGLEGLRREGARHLVVLSGDQPRVAERIAAALGIDDYRGGLLPGEKVAILEELAAKDQVAMVGDGINDAPALAAAHVGVAMGGVGTDVALESADVVLMRDDLRALAYAYYMAKKTQTFIKMGLAFASGVIVLLVTLTLTNHLILPLAVVGHEGSTVLVALNGLRLLRTDARGRQLLTAPLKPFAVEGQQKEAKDREEDRLEAAAGR